MNIYLKKIYAIMLLSLDTVCCNSLENKIFLLISLLLSPNRTLILTTIE